MNTEFYLRLTVIEQNIITPELIDKNLRENSSMRCWF